MNFTVVFVALLFILNDPPLLPEIGGGQQEVVCELLFIVRAIVAGVAGAPFTKS